MTQTARLTRCPAGIRALLFMTVIVAIVPAASSQAVDFTPRFKAGQVDIYTLTQKAENRVVAPSSKTGASTGPVDQTLEQNYTLRLTVDEVLREGGARLSLVYERARVKFVTPDRTIEVDSDKPGGADDPIAAALAGIAGTTMRLTADARGVITGVEGGADTLGLSALLGPSGAGLAGKDAVSVLMPGTAPPSRARVGDSWNSTTRLGGPLLGDIAMTLRHSLESVRSGIATVAIKGSIEPATAAKGAQDSIARISSASTDGSYLWNTERGGLDRLSLRQVVRMESDLIEPGRVMESTSVTEVRRDEAAPTRPTPQQPENPRKPRS